MNTAIGLGAPASAGPDQPPNPWVREHYGFADLAHAQATPAAEGAQAAGRLRGPRRTLATLAVAVLSAALIAGVGGRALAAAGTNDGPGAGVTAGFVDHGPDGGHGRGRH